MENRFRGMLAAALTVLMLPYAGAASAAPAATSVTTSAAASAPASDMTAAPALGAVAASAQTDATVAAGTAFKQILAGTYYSVALRADGTVWTWGRNLWGELGVLKDGALPKVPAPVRLPALSDMTAIATNGTGMQVGLKADGTVWEWGAVPGLVKAFPGSALPVQVEGLSGVKAVVPGFALTTDGKLLSWANDTVTGAVKVTPVPGTYKWTTLTASGNLAVGLDAAEGVWVLRARQGTDGSADEWSPSRLAGLPPMKKISGLTGVDRNGGAWMWTPDPGIYYTGAESAPVSGKAVRLHPELKVKDVQGDYLLTATGEVWAIGKGTNGKTGKVKGLPGIAAIASGYAHSLALDAQGRIWGWGANKWDETGSLESAADGMLYTPAPVQRAISVYVNGKLLAAPFPARIDNGSASVPMKYVIQALGGSFGVTAGSAATVTYKNNTATMLAGRAAAINGTQVVLPDVRKFAYVTMIPVELLKLLGVHAAWDGKLGELRLTGV